MFFGVYEILKEEKWNGIEFDDKPVKLNVSDEDMEKHEDEKDDMIEDKYKPVMDLSKSGYSKN